MYIPGSLILAPLTAERERGEEKETETETETDMEIISQFIREIRSTMNNF